jgi:hypothetical protein
MVRGTGEWTANGVSSRSRLRSQLLLRWLISIVGWRDSGDLRCVCFCAWSLPLSEDQRLGEAGRVCLAGVVFGRTQLLSIGTRGFGVPLGLRTVTLLPLQPPFHACYQPPGTAYAANSRGYKAQAAASAPLVRLPSPVYLRCEI